MFSPITLGSCLMKKICLFHSGHKLRIWARRLEMCVLELGFLCYRNSKQLWYLMFAISFFFGSNVHSQPNKSLQNRYDSSGLQNNSDPKVIPLFILTEDRNPIKQVLGIEFGKLGLKKIPADSLLRVSLGIPFTDSARNINNLNDLINSFQNLFKTSIDSMVTPKDTSGNPQDIFHFVHLDDGLAAASCLMTYRNYSIILRRKYQ